MLKRRGNPIRKMLDSEAMLLVTSTTSSFADVDTSRETLYEKSWIPKQCCFMICSSAVVETLREPYTKNVGFRSHVACIF
jgi:hypothetical protein